MSTPSIDLFTWANPEWLEGILHLGRTADTIHPSSRVRVPREINYNEPDEDNVGTFVNSMQSVPVR